jgi:membrane-bound ClpP family serine protease
LAIAARLAVVFVASFAVFCVWLGMPVDLFLVICAVILVLFPLATVDFIPAADAVGFAINVLFFLPIYALKQFILGFPDREILMPSPEPHVPTSTDLTGLRGAVGTVTATLKPFGKVQIEAIEYDATAVGGQMLDRGSSVRVTDIRHSILVVTEFRQ